MQRPRFIIPRSLEEAEQREADLLIAIRDIEEQITARQSEREKGTPVAGWASWHESACVAKRMREGELAALRSWITRRTFSANAVPKTKEWVDHVRNAIRLFSGLKSRGLEFTQGETEAIDQLRHAIQREIKFLPENAESTLISPIDLARACRTGSIECIAKIGLQIACVTLEDRDLEVLRENQRESIRRKASGSPMSIQQATNALIVALIHFGRQNEARRFAEWLGASFAPRRETVEAWCSLASEDPDADTETIDRYFALARAQAELIAKPEDKVPALIYLYNKSGEPQDLARVLEELNGLEQIGSETNRIEKLSCSFIQGLIKHAEITKARERLSQIRNTLVRAHALSELIMAEREPADVVGLLDILSSTKIFQIALLREIFQALIAGGRKNTAIAFARSLPGALCCFSLSVVSACLDGDERTELVRSAAEIAARMSTSDSHTHLALLELCRALIADGRIEQAQEIAWTITNPYSCAEANLAIYQAEQGL